MKLKGLVLALLVVFIVSLGGQAEAFSIKFDYRYDTQGWFTPEKKAVLNAAAAKWTSHIGNSFKKMPNGTLVSVLDPQTGTRKSTAIYLDGNDLVIFVGANGSMGNKLGWSDSNSINTSENAYQVNVGSIQFNSNLPWYYGTGATPRNQYDFMNNATHEIGHVLGLGPSYAYVSKMKGGFFQGQFANGVKLSSDGHLDYRMYYADLMNPITYMGVRRDPGDLNFRMLRDIGYTIK